MRSSRDQQLLETASCTLRPDATGVATVVEISDRLVILLGTTRADIVGRSAQSVFCPENHDIDALARESALLGSAGETEIVLVLPGWQVAARLVLTPLPKSESAPNDILALFMEPSVARGPETGYPTGALLADGQSELLTRYRTDLLAVKEHAETLERTQDELERKNSELSALAVQLRDARLAAEESNQAKSRFLAHMSHELRTPLNGILGFTEVMSAGLFGLVEPPRYREYIALIHNSGQLLLSLINDILDMSKIEAGKMELQIEPIAVDRLASSIRSMMDGIARDAGVVLRISIDENCSEIDADTRAAKQMIINLMSNAVKFTPAGGIVRLQFSNLGTGGIKIVVADSGIGMTPEELEKALQPFGQVDSEMSRQHKGTGIGLTLVQSLAGLHGGTFRLESEKGRGTTATIVLPWHRQSNENTG